MIPVSPARIRRSHGHRLTNTIKIAPYLFTAPFVISFFLFFLYPMIYMLIMSFQRIEGISSVSFVGLDNFRRLVSDSNVRAALLNSVSFTVGMVVVNVVLSVLLAIVLNNKTIPLRNVFRTALYLPALTSIIVAGVFFRLFFGSSESTPLNQLVSLFGVASKGWLFDTVATGIAVLVFTATWRWLGTNILYFLCGLQSIPPELYEAADIDGANPFQRLRYVTLPGLRPMMIFVVTVTTYGGLRMFGESYVLWVNGTTPGDVGMTIVLYIYKIAFARFETGYAAALSVALFLLLIVINLVYIKGLRIGAKAV